ncbi:MAG: hypothetical protein HQM15_10195 [Deltaproteobacteria bacterium]|nr:hypothetical protein [Deltaproteobacteria bacterium]
MTNPSASKKTSDESIPGYPRIEKLIDTEEFDSLNKDFAAAYGTLEKIARQKAGLAKSKQAKKVMKSLELVMTLLKDLLKLKYQMVEASKK